MRLLKLLYIADRELLAERFLPITSDWPVAIDRVKNLVGLFDGVGLDGIESLFAVPRTSARTSKSRHNGDYPLEKLAGGGWHSSIQSN